MATSEEWRDIKYREIFDQEIRGLERRRKSDSALTADDLEGILKNLYIKDGADQDGRGSLQDTIISATIAAYEQFITQWRSEPQ